MSSDKVRKNRLKDLGETSKLVGENTLRNAEFDHAYFAELQVRNVRLSVGSRELL